MSRYWSVKQQFFQTDPTAKYLTDKLALTPPVDLSAIQGSFSWVIKTLGLDAIATFTLALGLIGSFDPAAGSVISACLSDPNTTRPTLALAQLLWDSPEPLLSLADLSHPLWRYGCFLQPINFDRGVDWYSPIVVPPIIANSLLFPNSQLRKP